MTEPAKKATPKAVPTEPASPEVVNVGNPEWVIQVSKTIEGDLWNIRASSVNEFADVVEGLAINGDEILSNLGTFTQAALAKTIQTKSTGGGGQRATTASSPSDGPPSCKHGPMKDLKEKNYRNRYYCSSSNRDDQCKPRD